ncbi:signal peptidase I [Sporosarcina cyprini]|uniref:signal peptidase I n=1 Tax=Sporosarcina cyprini TaxID=2910523 RepID=UPI001EDD71D9|nr:signal peptidase I [Sporosarcina cyprini]MCG3088021.1 signal peptidase I [Sporosarcina cyprini]
MKKLLLFIPLIFLIGCQSDNQSATYVFDGRSMEPTIYDQDHFVVDKDYYESNPIQRGDIVVYLYDDNQKHAKRVLGLPGEEIQFRNGTMYIDGNPLETEYVTQDIKGSDPVTLQEDEYFVVGDSPSVSKDSRHHGPIKKEDLVGKVTKIVSE